MNPRILTLDLGNSRAKLRRWGVTPGSPPVCEAHGILEGDDRLAERVAAWIDEGPRPNQAVLASVGSPAVERAVAAAVAERVDRLDVGPPPGIENRCRTPETTGADRLYAARAAVETVGGSAVVVDAGTALTVDAAVLEENGHRAFLGGAIAPGPHLLAQSLEEGAARLPYVTPRPGARALGRDTEEAIRSGVVEGFRGAARGLVGSIAFEAGFAQVPVVVSGGARSFLLKPRPFLSGHLVEVEDLVHLGLLWAGLDAVGVRP